MKSSIGGETSERRARFREILKTQDGVDADDVIMPPEKARERGLTSTMIFPRGNLAPEGSVVKSTAIDPTLIGPDGVYRLVGPARVFVSEAAAIAAIKKKHIQPGDVMVLAGIGPLGTGMEETYQVTSALKHLPLRQARRVVDRRAFSGVSTGACIGHIGPKVWRAGRLASCGTATLFASSLTANKTKAALISSVKAADDLRPRKARKFFADGAHRVPTSRRIPRCPTTRGFGPLCNRSAAAHGAVAFMMWRKLSRRLMSGACL